MTKLRQPIKHLAVNRGYLFVLVAFATGLLFVTLVDFQDTAQAQRPRVRRPASRPSSPASRIDYSRFSHATKKHQGACITCHEIPTDNWKKVRGFPDVADYPGHDACVSCHRSQFFKGAKPVICSICHSKVSPRDDVRFAFRNPAAPRQFLIEFPHDKHQDVIALLGQPPYPARLARLMDKPFSPAVTQTVRLRVWAHTSLVAPEQSQTNSLRYNIPAVQTAVVETKHYNNCEICHGPRTTVPVAPPTGWVDSFVPDAAAFRAVPTSHASCFNCHWKSEQPIGENCGGCHKSLSMNVSTLLPVNPKPTDFVPVVLPELRISRKFRHAREQHVAECTTCHINITKAKTLVGLQPDVPITSCTECHNKDGLRQDVSKELEAIDKNRDFVCSYCHTSDIGRRDPPSRHYLIAGRDPLKRKDVK